MSSARVRRQPCLSLRAHQGRALCSRTSATESFGVGASSSSMWNIFSALAHDMRIGTWAIRSARLAAFRAHAHLGCRSSAPAPALRAEWLADRTSIRAGTRSRTRADPWGTTMPFGMTPLSIGHAGTSKYLGRCGGRLRVSDSLIAGPASVRQSRLRSSASCGAFSHASAGVPTCRAWLAISFRPSRFRAPTLRGHPISEAPAAAAESLDATGGVALGCARA